MSEVEDIAALIREAEAKPHLINTGDGRAFIVLPGQMNNPPKLEQITLTNAAEVLMPKVVTQHVKLQTKKAMIDYVSRFKNTDTVLFADAASGNVVAIIDYHLRPDPDGTSNPKATLGVHRATLPLRLSNEWIAWMDENGEWQSQLKFAEFLEENGFDCKEPTGVRLLDTIRSLKGTKNATWDEDVGAGAMARQVNSKTISLKSNKGDIDMPLEFKIEIPVYFGEAPLALTALTRWDVTDKGLQLGYKIVRTETVRENEYARIVNEIGNAVALTTVVGTPA